jgi:hypothetical protein
MLPAVVAFLLTMCADGQNSRSASSKFPIGAVICPETKLHPPLKQSSILIAVVGCDVDPLLPILEIEDVPVEDNNGTNCNSEGIEVCQLPGTYLITM